MGKIYRASLVVLLLFMSCCGLWAASLTVEPFESAEGMQISSGLGTGSLALSSEIVTAGNHSLKVAYNLPSGSWTWSDIKLNVPRELPAAAGKIGFWVYGNNSGNRIVFTVHDASGEWFQYLTWSAESTLNWGAAWKWIEIDLTKFSLHSGGNADGIVDAPARLGNIVLQAPPFTEKEEVIYLDDLTFTAENVGCVSGTVIDAMSALPIADAIVSVSEVPASVTKTDSQGNFSLFVPPGNRNLVLSRSGYEQQIIPLAIAAEESLTLPTSLLTPASDSGSVYSDKANADEQGIALLSGIGGESWQGEIVEIGARQAVKLNRSLSANYLFYDIADDYLYDGSNAVNITIEYYDNGTGLIGLQYDSPSSAAKLGGVISRTNTNTWKEATIFLPDAVFANRTCGQTGDFRLGIWVPGSSGGFQDDAYIGKVSVAKKSGIVSLDADKAAISSALFQTAELCFELTTNALATLTIYNAQNQAVKTLLDQTPIYKFGVCGWDGTIDGAPAAEGIYTVRLSLTNVAGESLDTEELTIEVVNHGPAVMINYPVPKEGEVLQNNRPYINVQGKILLEPGKTATVSVKRRVNGTEEAVTTGVQTQPDGSFSCQAPLVTEDVNELWLVAYDALGNHGEPSDSVFILYDPEALYGLVRVENSKLLSPQNQQGGKTALRVSLFPSADTTSRLEIKDASGQTVFTAEEAFQAVDQELTLTWDGKDQEGVWAADGIYTYTVTITKTADGRSETVVNDTVEVDNTAPIAPLLLYPQAGAGITNNKPTLHWKAVADAASYLLALDDAETWITISENSYALTEPLAEGAHIVKIKAVDRANNESEVSEVAFTVTELDEGEFSVVNFTAGPNPLNLRGLRSQLAIAFTLRQPAEVKLFIFNLAGAVIRKFDLGSLDSGDQLVVWDGRDAKGRMVAAGPYLLRLEAFNRVAGGEVALSKPILCLR